MLNVCEQIGSLRVSLISSADIPWHNRKARINRLQSSRTMDRSYHPQYTTLKKVNRSATGPGQPWSGGKSIADTDHQIKGTRDQVMGFQDPIYH
jgi:hypothetical protein